MNRPGRSYSKRRSRAGCILITLVMLFSLWAGISIPAGEVHAAGDRDSIMDPALPEDYDENDSTNPYTNDNQKFLLAENNELMLYKSWNVNKDSKNKWISMADNYSNGKSMKLAKDSATDKAGWNSVIGDTSATSPSLNYQDSVAFDPSGTGRKDHVAFVGWRSGHNYLWVYDTVNRKASAEFQLPGSFSGGGLNDFNYLTSRNFYTITAGDYNDDGKDTIVVYDPANGSSFSVMEYRYKNSSFTKLGSSQRMLHSVYCSQSGIANVNKIQNKLGCSLTTGDFDGDGVDDLGVISYGQEYDGRSSFSDHRLYAPMVAAVFGDDQDKNSKGSDWSVVSSGHMQTTFAEINKSRETISDEGCDTYESMRSPSISAGDVDGNGLDELVFSGFYSKIKDTGSAASYHKTIDYGKLTAGAVSVNRKSINITGNTLSANEWTKHAARHHKFNARVQIATECVALNGQSAEETVFINGTFYQFAGNGFGKISTSENYFDSDDGYIGGSETAASAVTDVVSGVFDGNSQGREQVMFVIAQREWGAASGNDVYVTLGTMGGSDYDDTNTAKKYYTSNIDGDHYSISNKGDDTDQYLNLCLAAADNDQDGLLGSYHDKKCIYNDPKTAAVLQGSPLFGDIDDIGGYDDSGETSYSLSTTYEKGTTSGDSVSFGAGFAANVEFSLGASFDAEIRLGYSLDWNKSFENSTATTYTTSFSAQTQDQVIVSRIPVTVYNYDLYKADGTKQEYGYAVSVPGKPVYYQMGIDEYNEFVDEYNKHVDKVSTSKAPVKLKKINKDSVDSSGKYDLPADNTGNPQNYFSSWAQAGEGATTLSQSPLALSYNTGSSTSEWNKSESSTKSVEMSHGFSFEATVLAGGGFLGNNAKLGGYTSLDYMHTNGSFETSTKESGASGTVQNINESSLISAGLPKAVVRAYGFNWEFGTWKRELTTTSADYTPFFGYRVWNVTMPPDPPENLEAENSDTDGLHSVDLTWDAVDSDLVLGYNIYIKNGSEYTKINKELVKDTKYTVSGLDTNTEYIFVVTTEAYTDITGKDKTKTANSVWSDEASVRTPRQGYHITLTTDRGATLKATGGEKDINSGDEIFEGDAVSIKAEAREGYTITQILMKKADGSELDITSTDGTFNFVVKGDTEIIVKSKKNVVESEIIYSAGAGGSIVSAVSDGHSFKSGAMISDDVTLEAKADKGYVLKEWQIKTGSTVQTVAANGSSTYTFGPFAAKHEITAVFIEKDDPSVTRTISVASSNGGSIRIADKDGNIYKPENGKVTVNVGTELKISALADQHYVLRTWTGDFASVSKETTTISHTIYEDMTIGAEFYAPVKYKVYYDVNDKKCGSITTDVKHGGSYVEDTELVFKAVPEKGYRLEYWKIVKGSDESKVETKELKSEYELKLNVEDTTKVTACFKKIEEFKLTLKPSDYGTVTAVDQNSKDLKDGDTFYYGDKLTITAEPKQYHELKALKVNDREVANGSETVAYSDITAEAEYLRLLSENGKPCPDVEVKVQPSSLKYTGKELRPDVTVTVDGKTLTDEDFTLSYSSNKKPGTATVTIEGKGFYKGTVAQTFTIKENPDLHRSDLNRSIRISMSGSKVNVKWSKVDIAEGYDVFLAKCGSSFSKKPALSTKKTSIAVSKISGKKVSSSENYKALVKAYRMIDGKKHYITSSEIVHVAGTKSKKYTNPSKITGIPDAKTLKTGKTYAIKGKVKKANSKKALLPAKHANVLRYNTSDRTVATVTSKGVIKAAGKGTCKVYAVTLNGISKYITVTVK